MEQIQSIQALIHEHSEKLPTGAVTKIMEDLQKMYSNKVKPCKVTCTWIYFEAYVVDSDEAHIHKVTRRQTMIIDLVEDMPRGVYSEYGLLAGGRGLNTWLKDPNQELPVLHSGDNLCIVHSLTPLTPVPAKKRARAH